MAVDQHPVQPRIAGNADEEHGHDGPRVRQSGEQAAQHRKAEKGRPTPRNRSQKAADLASERGVVAQPFEQAIHARHHGDKGRRQQHGQRETSAGDPSRRTAVAGAERVRGERRHGGEDVLQHHAAGEIKHCAQPRRGERRGAEAPHHHRVGNPHRHLREIGGGERRREGKGCAKLRANAATAPIGGTDRFHLALSVLRHDAAADLGERPSKRKGPRPVPAGARNVACSSCSAHAHTLWPHGKAARVDGLRQEGVCANHRRFVEQGWARVNHTDERSPPSGAGVRSTELAQTLRQKR